ncbi:hypothetical protein BDZ91DRAFT_97576 [Kalaharituber pfeilii]|nr:hypothetical protein BDZ91DRAFT_97576 [Kalaharituber pfeilii]
MRKWTGQKYADMNVPFDDLSVDPSKEKPIERTRKPYVNIKPPGKTVRGVMHPRTNAGSRAGGGTHITPSRQGGLDGRPGSHDTNGSGGSGSGRPGGGAVELDNSSTGTSAATAANGGGYNGIGGVKTPDQLKNPRDSRILQDLHRRYGSTSTVPLTKGAANPNTAGAQFSSPQGRIAAAVGGDIHPLVLWGAHSPTFINIHLSDTLRTCGTQELGVRYHPLHQMFHHRNRDLRGEGTSQ